MDIGLFCRERRTIYTVVRDGCADVSVARSGLFEPKRSNAEKANLADVIKMIITVRTEIKEPGCMSAGVI